MSTLMKISAMCGLRVASTPISIDEALFFRGLVDEVVFADGGQGFEEVGRICELGEPLREFRSVSLAKTGDQRFLAVEIDVERAGTDARLAADALHRRRVKAAPSEAA